MSIITATIQTGAYISVVKLAVFVIAFFLWIPLIKWINSDAEKVHTNVARWTIAIFVAGLAGSVIWLVIPLFIIGFLMYLVAVAAMGIIYVMHRNSLVSEFQRVLTVEHIKGLFVNEKKQVEKITKGLVFITANKNTVPMPQSKTPEFFGFKTSQEFFNDAIWRRASDAVLLPSAQQYDIHLVIDGVAEKQPPRDREEIEFFLRYLKNLADLDVEEKRKPQVGRFIVQKDGIPHEWELTTAGTTAGEQIRLKLFAEYNLMQLPGIGLLPDQLEQFQTLRSGPKGVFIVSGPKKNGVTSSLYALLRNNDPFMNNINVLEKKPAGELPNITQVVYSMSDTGTTTYARKFQTMLRTGPEIIGVEHGEEKDVAKLACLAAKDNKMVYVTLDSSSVVETMGKWLNLVGDRKLAIDTLIGISNQRLVRKLCDKCREPYEPNRDMLRKFNIPAEKIKVFYRPGQAYTKHGKPILCENCQGTGFHGREAIFEYIILTDETKKLLKQAKSMADIANIFRHARMLYMQEQAIRKVATGLISINEVIRALSGSQDAKKKKTTEAME
ncbi:MAG: ATPase, T2SS/T4P/T4SS family [Phycisphaerae bacterium]|nr:ATPase, T2SS/T4P/T4SS family [Phycisphaerae bacterium]